MILAHHRSMLGFAWRTGSAGERALFPLVAAAIAARSGAACAAKWRHGDRSRSPRGVG
jgi:hypothetical protein